MDRRSPLGLLLGAAPTSGRLECPRMRPLEGITVVALEQVLADPYATRQLAELGARVSKIERPGGGDAARSYDRTVKGLSSRFVWTNRSKESLSLDAKHPEAKQILCRLIERADVFVQNLAPGAADRLGLGAADLRARQPRLVWCGISGYGPSGPYAEKKAYDLLVQCEAGLLSVTGTSEAASKAGIPPAGNTGTPCTPRSRAHSRRWTSKKSSTGSKRPISPMRA